MEIRNHGNYLNLWRFYIFIRSIVVFIFSKYCCFYYSCYVFFPLSKTEKAFDFRNGSMLFIVFLKLWELSGIGFDDQSFKSSALHLRLCIFCKTTNAARELLPSKHLLVLKTSSRRLQDMSWGRLQHIFSVTTFSLSRRLQNVFKTSWKRLEDISQDVLKTTWKTENCYAEDVLKTFWKHVLKTCLIKCCFYKWDKVFKSGPCKICGRQPLKNVKGYGLLKQNLFKFF